MAGEKVSAREFERDRSEELEMKREALSLLPIALSFFICVACSLNQIAERRPLRAIIGQDSLRINQQPDKVCYLQIEKTFFLLNKTENSVRIYKNGEYHNIIGGSGFGSENFRKLSDICVGFDGFLYTLDSFDKSIKRFDKDGKYVGQMNINFIPSPEKFAFTQYGEIFVYDGHSKEVINLDAFNYSSKFSFGKFQLEQADIFFIAGEYLNIYDQKKDETSIFFTNGMYVNSFKYQAFYDMHKNLLTIKGNILSGLVDSGVPPLPSPTPQATGGGRETIFYNLEGIFLILGDGETIKVWKMVY
jgi:hypothetical protein